MASSLSAFNYLRTSDLDPNAFACTTIGSDEVITTFPYEISVLSGCTLELSTGAGYTDTVDLSAAIAFCLSIGAAVIDTNTIDLTLTGSGTAGDPYVFTGDVLYNTTHNSISADGDGLLVNLDPISTNPISAGANGITFDYQTGIDSLSRNVLEVGLDGTYLVDPCKIFDFGNTLPFDCGGLSSI